MLAFRRGRALIYLHLRDAVCRRFGVTPCDLIDRSKFARIAKPRQTFMALLRDGLGLSFEQIAAACHRLDHGTARHACHVTTLRRQTDPIFAAWYHCTLRNAASATDP